MRGEVYEPFRESNRHLGVTAPREAATAARTPIETSAALWLATADSLFKWYDAMFRLALGLSRVDGRGEPQGPIAPSASVKDEKRSEAPAESSPAEVLHFVPRASAKLRPKRRKNAARRKKGARSSKMSRLKRNHRRAA